MTENPSRFLLSDGRLDCPLLLDAFADFWVDHGAKMANTENYREAGMRAPGT